MRLPAEDIISYYNREIFKISLKRWSKNEEVDLLTLMVQYGMVELIKMFIVRGREVGAMPEISLFYGIRITMYWNDHNPPHFHAEYGNNKALVLIEEGIIIEGFLPKRQLKFVLAWAELHKDELMQNWELAKDNKPLNRINPLI